jgi:hypothetical protein
VALNPVQAARLARALRNLRESAWTERKLTQAGLAYALSSEGHRVAPATLASWESTTAPKTPSSSRVSAYARFFCTQRSLDGGPHLIPKDSLTAAELDQFSKIESDLLRLFNPDNRNIPHFYHFDTGPVSVICPTIPTEVLSPLANESNLNFTKLHQYGDLDALMDLYAHLRVENPTLSVAHRLSWEASTDDFSNHVILLGGLGRDEFTRHLVRSNSQVPITQRAVEDLKDGDIFQVDDAFDRSQQFYPELRNYDGNRVELVTDVAYVARLRHPFKASRTLTICNGIYSRGVLGAVRCFTDASVRRANENYVADRFPNREFALLLRVPVVGSNIVAPELQDPATVLYEWAGTEGSLATSSAGINQTDY